MAEIPAVDGIEQLARIVSRHGDGHDLYVRWSSAPRMHGPGVSWDALTGVELPGLSANPLRVESWWEQRPLRLWVARRLYDYDHLRRRQHDPTVDAWLLRGHELARGPDNEPLIACDETLARITERTLQEARKLVGEQHSEWHPLNREP